ncbi:MAG: molybdopterin-dependent oxidoreductase [Planctomycetes bacterium]|nr:molybdopterin-dependent oxidoreductase [Planctomycetota bacterium]
MTRSIRTSCTQDCPDACGLMATVEGGRVIRLSGDPAHPITRGFLCFRVGQRYLGRLASPERLNTPLRRENGRFAAMGWDEALDLIAERLRRIRDESGAAAVLHLQGGGSLGMLKNLNTLFFRLFGGATETCGDVCDGAGSFANMEDLGACDANGREDLCRARGVLLWGRNVVSSSPHTAPLLQQARKSGAALWLIDPLPHATRRLVDRFLQPRPGGDAALALGAARAVLDQGLQDRDVARYSENLAEFQALVRSRSVAGWCAEADLEESAAFDLARFMVERAPVTSILGWGLQRRGNGATQVRAITALHALTGNIGREGACAWFTTPRRRPFDLSCIQDLAAAVPRRLLMPLLGQEILAAKAPPIRAVVVDNCNPVATLPDSTGVAQALASREFVVAIDPFLTDTARAAHVVLPCTMMLEEADLVGSYGHHYVSACQPVAERLAGTLSDLEIYQALAARLGFGERLAGTPEEWCERLLARLKEDGIGRADLLERARLDPRAPAVAFAGRRFATPSCKFRFLTEHRAPPPSDPEFPLLLCSVSSRRWQTSQLTAAEEGEEGPLTATVHPDAAAGVPDGGEALLESRGAALRVVVRHDADFRRDTVLAPRARSLQLGRCVNALIRPRLTDHGEGCDYYDEGVRLRRMPQGPQHGRDS